MALLNRALERPKANPGPALRLERVLLVAGVVIIVVALLQLMQSSEAVTSSFAIQQLGSERIEHRARVSQLEAEIASLSSLSRIEREAQERLGLEPPPAQQSVAVNVPWPGADQQRLPTRFAPAAALPAEEEAGASGWWQDLLNHLPFR